MIRPRPAFGHGVVFDPNARGAVAYVGNTRFSWISVGDDVQRRFFGEWATLGGDAHLGLLNDWSALLSAVVPTLLFLIAGVFPGFSYERLLPTALYHGYELSQDGFALGL